jgi:hypothetical protein
MTFFPDLGTDTQVARGDFVRAVGWLHIEQPYPQGTVPQAFAQRLRQFAGRSSESTYTLGLPIALGFHVCEFCGEDRGRGNFGVPDKEVLFIAPEMIAHYVEAHRYNPPPEFIEAVLEAPLPGTEEYRAGTERFRWQFESAAQEKQQPGRLSDEVKALADNPGEKIAAIKLHREQTGQSFPEAKEAVEGYLAGRGRGGTL